MRISCLEAGSNIVIQHDKSADISNYAKLPIYVRHVWQDDYMDDLLRSLNLLSNTTRLTVFSAFEERIFITTEFNWGNCKEVVVLYVVR
jgi:hypothetical protein